MTAGRAPAMINFTAGAANILSACKAAEVKTIVTRVGEGTKLVFTGDPYQIDNPYVDSSSNGFNYIVSRFREHPIAAHIELQKGERSELAELAANVL